MYLYLLRNILFAPPPLLFHFAIQAIIVGVDAQHFTATAIIVHYDDYYTMGF